MSPEKYLAGDIFAQSGDGVSKAVAISLCIAGEWGTGWFLLPEGQITAQNDEVILGKNFAYGYEERGVAIRSGAVGQDDGISARRFWAV
jgi:hypothetical protein